MFRLLRNHYGRDKEKVAKKKVSGAGAKDIEEAKETQTSTRLWHGLIHT